MKTSYWFAVLSPFISALVAFATGGAVIRGSGITWNHIGQGTGRQRLGRLLIRGLNLSNPMLRLRNGSIAGDGARLWNWFSSVQAAKKNGHGGRTRSAQDPGWSVSFWFAVLLAIAALAIFYS